MKFLQSCLTYGHFSVTRDGSNDLTRYTLVKNLGDIGY
jgi:hypothetical protein